MSSDILRYERPALTADCVLFTAVEKEDELRGGELVLQVRLVRRPNEPEEGKWALLGAFVPVEERIEDTMRRAALEKGGYADFYAKQLHTFDTPGRDERWRVVSVAYLGIAKMWTGVSAPVGDTAMWFSIDYENKMLFQPALGEKLSFDELAFDHGDILHCAVERLRKEAASGDIALEFLYDTFTIRDINRVMDAIFDKKTNNTKRTFSRYIEPADTEENAAQEKKPAHRPAQLFRRAR